VTTLTAIKAALDGRIAPGSMLCSDNATASIKAAMRADIRADTEPRRVIVPTSIPHSCQNRGDWLPDSPASRPRRRDGRCAHLSRATTCAAAAGEGGPMATADVRQDSGRKERCHHPQQAATAAQAWSAKTFWLAWPWSVFCFTECFDVAEPRSGEPEAFRDLILNTDRKASSTCAAYTSGPNF
jgi:hypothetical protein